MKRGPAGGDGEAGGSGGKRRRDGGDAAAAAEGARCGSEIGEDLLFEVLRHADAATLARAGCVSRLWRRTAEDERLWEGVCTRHWANLGCAPQQLRAVVLALGGFRRLHALYLRPLLQQGQPAPAASSSSFPPLSLPHLVSPSASSSSAPAPGRRAPARWGKDEVHLSLCLYSIRCFNDKITPAKR